MNDTTQRRGDDPEHEDHTRERSFDWKVAAPRWALVSCIGVLLVGFGAALGRLSSLDDSRVEILERYRNDARWEMIAKHTEEIAELRREQLRTSARLEKLDAMADDVRVLRKIAEAQSRAGKSSGGYRF